MTPCIHRWTYHHNATGTCAYKVCGRCGGIVWFTKRGCSA